MKRSATLILKLTNMLALNLKISSTHWKPRFGGVKHGPQVWAWWHLFSLSLISLEVYAPTTGKRLWLYTRWGALYADFILDRRREVKKRFQFRTMSWND